jgi:hypothetical protein
LLRGENRNKTFKVTKKPQNKDLGGSNVYKDPPPLKTSTDDAKLRNYRLSARMSVLATAPRNDRLDRLAASCGESTATFKEKEAVLTLAHSI